MIIIHADPDAASNPERGALPSGASSSGSGGGSSSSSNNFRILRPQPTVVRLSRKDWVKFDSSSESENEEEADNAFKNIEIDKETNRLNLQVDMKHFESVEINFVKKRRKQVQNSRTKILASEVLVRNLEILRDSSFYYERGEFDGETCTKLLSTTLPGTFLVRDSSDPNYLFTLSLQTDRGPTSVRLVYFDGVFRLDAADQRLIGALPSFTNVVQLVQYYVEENAKRRVERVKNGNSRQVWIDSATGRTHSMVKLTTPLRHQVPSLKHLSRLALNKSNCDTSLLPEPVKKYLNSYPFVL